MLTSASGIRRVGHGVLCALFLGALFLGSMAQAQAPAAPQAGPAPQPAAPPAAPDASKGSPPAGAVPAAGAAAARAEQAPAPGGTTVEKRLYRPPPPPADFSPPILHIEQPDFDWGNTLQGEVVKHSYIVMNKGGAPLSITQVKASCGCTTVAKPEKPIEPGKTDTITLEIDTKRLNGPVKKTADIVSNAGQTPVRVSMGGKVEAFFVVEPPAPRIEVVRGSAPQPTKVMLKRNSQATFKVKELKTESKIMKAALAEVTPGDLYEIAINADLGDDPRPYYYEQVDVKLDVNGKDFDVPIRVQVTVKNRIDVLPRSTVYFSRTEIKPLRDGKPDPISKTVEIKSLAGPEHVFKVTQVDKQTDSFETKLETVVEGKHYRLIVLLSKLPDVSTRTLREKIVVHTDDPSLKEIPINAIAALQ
jgi:hypothetical protein